LVENFFKYFFIVLILLVAKSAWADVHVSAVVSPSQATLEDEITLTVTVDGAQGSEPLLPSMPAFHIIPSGTSSSVQIINGDISSKKEYTYVLVPQNEGTFTIDPITVSVGGKEYKTEPVQLVISKSGAITKPQGVNPLAPFPQVTHPPTATSPNNPDKESRDSWITTEVSNKNPYVGEQILYTFRFFTRARVAEATLTLPDFKDFLAEEVVPEKKYYQEIGGDRFVVSEKVMSLFPLHEGKWDIAETLLRVEIPDVQSNNPFANDPFFGFGGGKTRPKNLRSDPISLEVKALPSPPSHFTNLVGQFSMTTELSSNSLKVGDTTTLTITFSGTGNIKDATLPNNLLDLGAFKMYSDKPATDTVKSENGIQGKKFFKVALVPTQAGDTSIPEFSLSYFDPKKGEYQTLNSNSFTLHVDSAEKEALNPVVSGETHSVTPLIAEDIATIHTNPGVLKISSRSINKGFWLLLGYLLPFLFFVTVAIFRSRHRYWSQNKKLYRSRVALKNFRQATSRLNPPKMKPEDFVSQLLESIRDFMGNRFGVYSKGLTATDIVNLLETNDVNRTLITEIRELIIRLEAGRYGGDLQLQNPEEWIKRALKLIPAIDKLSKKTRDR